ncbi:putative short chain oxidoreductase/dehydrogenase [Sphaerosporella brunnea]|uniref:Putative short chain oxidoreductase/dehydrogenase n=1 Tax=Sphaerosporella brunnea TaxID=1250544 RepID=A0A5J5ERS6_9PEZI|nr:putative short chain oxidoreductase/dehydrogenase [Sphaerosporella brunnea]
MSSTSFTTTASPVWFITGCSSGFGTGLAMTALKAGHRVIASSRNPSRTPELVADVEALGGHWLTLDTIAPNAKDVVRDAVKIYGHIDYLVNNAGYSLLGAIEDFSDEECRHQMEVNFFAPLRLVQAVLPSMRERKSGTIVNISSIAGLHGIETTGMYCASKFALEGFSESLQCEVKAFGIRVLVVEPGAFRSNFLSAFVPPAAGVSEPYKDTAVGRQFAAFEAWSGKQPGDVQLGCQRIFEVVTGTGMGKGMEGFLRLGLGLDWGERARRKIESLEKTYKAQEAIWRSTDIKE